MFRRRWVGVHVRVMTDVGGGRFLPQGKFWASDRHMSLGMRSCEGDDKKATEGDAKGDSRRLDLARLRREDLDLRYGDATNPQAQQLSKVSLSGGLRHEG